MFYADGIRATGVDRIAREAGVAPPTLYRLFVTKDDLVAAYIRREAERYRAWFDDVVAAGTDARDAVHGLIDAVGEQIIAGECRGCPFQIAMSELPHDGPEARREAVRLKRWMFARLQELVVAATCGASPGEQLDTADGLMLLIEGMYATAPSLGRDGPLASARLVARRLLPPSE